MRIILLLFMLLSSACVQITSGEIEEAKAVAGKSYFACNTSGTGSLGLTYTFYPDGKFVLDNIYYHSINCESTSRYEQNIIYGIYSFNSISGEFAEKANKLKIAYLSQDEIDSQNSSSQCGFSDWEINVLKNVTDNELCMGGTVASDSDPIIYQATFNESVFDDGSTTYTRVNQ